MRQARAHIVAFREYVDGELRYSRPNISQIPLMYRALGIPSFVPMTITWWMVLLCVFVTPFIPIRLRLQIGRMLLRRIRTYEGKAFVYERFVAPVWNNQRGQWYFSDGFDHALRHLPLARTAKSYEDLLSMKRGYVTAAIRLGLNRVEDLPETWREIRQCYEPEVIHALIDEGAIQKVEELRWIPTRRNYGLPLEDIDIATMRSMVRQLLQANMPREKVPLILNYPYRYDPAQLSSTLTLLQARGILDVSGVYEAVEANLWRADEASWHFVVDTIGVRTSNDFKRFRSLFDLSHPAPVAVTTWMREHGASLDDLFEARGFLKQAASMKVPPVACLDALAQRAMLVTDIVHCADYVLQGRPDRLETYLDVLTRYGYGDCASILAFHPCYTHMDSQTLDFWLGLVGALNDRSVASVVAKWAVRACARRHTDSLKYIIGKLPPANLDALTQRLFVMDMCPALVRHVVEVQGLNDLKALNHWYHHEAWGAKDYAGGSEADALETILIEDAFRRKNFVVLEGNRACLEEVVSARARTQVPPPSDHSKADWETCQKARERAEEREREALRPILPRILEETHGILLRSVLEAACSSEASISALLAVLRPLLVDLACGRGPVHKTLTDLESEAVALTYGVQASMLSEYWGRAIGQGATWGAWDRDEPYLMRWQHNTLKIKGTLDHEGLQCLVDAVQFARRFSDRDGDIFTTCKHLRGNTLTKPRPDHYALRRHLGVLLAVASEDEIVKEWLSHRLEALTHLDDESSAAHREISELNDFLHVNLPDALEASLDRFIARFSDDDARHLALRLDASSGSVTDAKSMLCGALHRTRAKVLEVYQRWSAREKGKFKMGGDVSHQSTLHAFVSKYPAAFFAKLALGLCSWNRVALWQEARHAHLVVFDPLTGKLAGVALLYVEVIPDLDRTRPSLIIRGINPTGAMVANHDPHSIVKSFFDVAISLAREHGLVGVAFPCDGGQDFMSNRDDIGKVIRQRFEKRHVPLYRDRERLEHEIDWRDAPRLIRQTFYAYEQGDGRIETLYAIWAAPITALPPQRADGGGDQKVSPAKVCEES